VARVGRRRPASVGSDRHQEPASEEEVGGVGRRRPASVGGGRRQEAVTVLGCGVGFQGREKRLSCLFGEREEEGLRPMRVWAWGGIFAKSGPANLRSSNRASQSGRTERHYSVEVDTARSLGPSYQTAKYLEISVRIGIIRLNEATKHTLNTLMLDLAIWLPSSSILLPFD
jgi:hypothetical protein